MKKSRHSEEKVIAAVKQMEGGRKTADVAQELGVSAATLYAWEGQVQGQAGQRDQAATATGGRKPAPEHLVADLSLYREVLRAVIPRNGWAS
jgi:putative transposase